jgi:hypothetical protein
MFGGLCRPMCDGVCVAGRATRWCAYLHHLDPLMWFFLPHLVQPAYRGHILRVCTGLLGHLGHAMPTAGNPFAWAWD